MKFCTQIQKEKVIKKALSLLKRAKERIDTTMDLKEELDRPLPSSYHENLAKLSKRGVVISRYTYGGRKDHEQMKKMHPEINTYYMGKIPQYQRMLIIDKSFGLFALSGNVYFTSFPPLVQSLLKYVKILE